MKKSIENSFEMVYFYCTHIRIVIEKHTLRVIRIEQGFLRNIIGDKKIKKKKYIGNDKIIYNINKYCLFYNMLQNSIENIKILV